MQKSKRFVSGVGHPSALPSRSRNNGNGGTISIKLNDREQLASYAMEVLSANGLRRHTLGVYVVDGEMEMWYFDRAGAVGSKMVDFTTYSTNLFHFIQLLHSVSPEALGFDPDFKSSETAPTTRQNLHQQAEQKYPTSPFGYFLSVGEHSKVIVGTPQLTSRGLVGGGESITLLHLPCLYLSDRGNRKSYMGRDALSCLTNPR